MKVHMSGRIDKADADKAAELSKKANLTESELLRIVVKRGLRGLNWRHIKKAVTALACLLALNCPAITNMDFYYSLTNLCTDDSQVKFVPTGVPVIYSATDNGDVTNIEIGTNYTGTIIIGKFVFRESDIKSETIFGSDMGATWPMGNRLVLMIATNVVTVTNTVTVTNSIFPPPNFDFNAKSEPLTINWIGCPMVSDNDPYTPSQGWVPDYILGLRSDGVVIWSTNADKTHGF